MAPLSSSSPSSWPLAGIFISFFLLSTTAGTATGESAGFFRGRKKQTHLRFFFQDVLSGPNPTAIPIASAPSSDNNTTVPLFARFGTLTMFDDALTETEDPNSKVLGRAQGMYGQASQRDVALLLILNFVFSDGSSIAVVGRNAVVEAVRELPIVGGSGKFRWATGYVLARTSRFDPVTGDATVQFDAYVVHRGGR